MIGDLEWGLGFGIGDWDWGLRLGFGIGIFNLISSSVLSVNKADAGMFGVSDVGECTIIPRLCSNFADVQFIIIYFPFLLFPSTISKSKSK